MGILMVLESRVDAARDGSIFDAVTTQLGWGLLGGLVLVVAMRIDYRHWRLFSVLGLGVAVGLLLLVLMPAIPPLIQPIEANGATRWLRIGGLPAFHPAELAKLALVIYLAHWLATRGSDVGSVRRGLFPFLIVVGLVALLVVLEPDPHDRGPGADGVHDVLVAGGSIWQLPLVRGTAGVAAPP
jgi:cell division protein FtsW